MIICMYRDQGHELGQNEEASSRTRNMTRYLAGYSPTEIQYGCSEDGRKGMGI